MRVAIPGDSFWYLIICGVSIVLMGACLPPQADAQVLTPTPLPMASNTPSPTIIWFPPSSTPTLFPTAPSSTPTPEQRPGIGEILLIDDFSAGEGWPLLDTTRGSIALGNNELTLALLEPKSYLFTVRENTIFVDFYLEVTAGASLCSGFDEYGLLLRVASQADFYRFSLSCNGQTRLDRIYRGVASSPQPWKFSSAVPSVAPNTTRLAVWVMGREMRFFIDDQYQFTVADPVIPSGNIGLFARSAGENAVTVNFSDLVVREITSNE